MRIFLAIAGGTGCHEPFRRIYRFDGKKMKKHDCPKGKRLADSRKVALINYTEWIKFQKYAEENL